MMLGWFLSKARPPAAVNLMARGVCGFRGSGEDVCHGLVGSVRFPLAWMAREGKALPTQMVAVTFLPPLDF